MANNGTLTATCPHCASTGTYRTGILTSNGTTGAQCVSCRKHFNIEIRSGNVYQVRK
jgi:transcription elongation factor Elf1